VPELPRHPFGSVVRTGPSIADRLHGSTKLARRQRLGRVISATLARVEVTGLSYVPGIGPAILAVNHTTFLDGPLLFGLLGRPLSFLVKAEAFQPLGGVTGVILRDAAQLPVRRSQIDPGPIRYALELLDAGGLLGMFPEGTRGQGLVSQVRPGVGYLAVHTGAPVVPVAVVGATRMLKELRRTPVRIAFGPPLVFERATVPVHRAVWTAAADQVRVALGRLVQDTISNPVGPTARMEP